MPIPFPIEPSRIEPTIQPTTSSATPESEIEFVPIPFPIPMSTFQRASTVTPALTSSIIPAQSESKIELYPIPSPIPMPSSSLEISPTLSVSSIKSESTTLHASMSSSILIDHEVKNHPIVNSKTFDVSTTVSPRFSQSSQFKDEVQPSSSSEVDKSEIFPIPIPIVSSSVRSSVSSLISTATVTASKTPSLVSVKSSLSSIRVNSQSINPSSKTVHGIATDSSTFSKSSHLKDEVQPSSSSEVDKSEIEFLPIPIPVVSSSSQASVSSSLLTATVTETKTPSILFVESSPSSIRVGTQSSSSLMVTKSHTPQLPIMTSKSYTLDTQQTTSMKSTDSKEGPFVVPLSVSEVHSPTSPTLLPLQSRTYSPTLTFPKSHDYSDTLVSTSIIDNQGEQLIPVQFGLSSAIKPLSPIPSNMPSIAYSDPQEFFPLSVTPSDMSIVGSGVAFKATDEINPSTSSGFTTKSTFEYDGSGEIYDSNEEMISVRIQTSSTVEDQKTELAYIPTHMTDDVSRRTDEHLIASPTVTTARQHQIATPRMAVPESETSTPKTGYGVVPESSKNTPIHATGVVIAVHPTEEVEPSGMFIHI